MDIDMASLHTQVLTWVFVLALLLGALSQKTHFCTMGALSDVVNMGDYTRLRQWALAMAVAMIGFGLLAYTGQIDASKTIYANKRLLWLSALVGGCLFGMGMVLGSGCGSKTLVRIGSGNLKSLVVFLVMGVAAMATLKGITAVLRVNTVERVFADFSYSPTLGSWLTQWGLSLPEASLVAAALVGGCLLLWVFYRADFLQADNLLAGVGVGLLVTALWWVSGHLGHVLEHPQTLDEVFVASNTGLMESFTFTAPMAYVLDWLMFFSDTSKRLTIGVVSVTGVVLGSAIYALATRSFRWEGFRSTEDLANHLVGGVLMGVGGVTALGCTVGQGLSGMSTLAAGSFLAVAGIAGGAWLAFKYQMWRLSSEL
jgi:uncharacterized membrane protein YedE/YeeE